MVHPQKIRPVLGKPDLLARSLRSQCKVGPSNKTHFMYLFANMIDFCHLTLWAWKNLSFVDVSVPFEVVLLNAIHLSTTSTNAQSRKLTFCLH